MAKLPGIGLLHSVTTRIVLLTLAVLVAVGSVATLGLAQRERERLVMTKALAVTMTTELFAATVSAALDLGDERDVAERMEPLRSNTALLYAAVWRNGSSQPVGELGHRSPNAPAIGGPGVSQSGQDLTVVRPVLGPTGSEIGKVAVQVSLDPENRAFLALRTRIGVGALIMVAVTLGLLVAALHWGVVRRLHKVAQASLKLRSGENVRTGVGGSDELGQLGSAFDAMADAILERERRLANARHRLQTLLDHMGQAIVTFDHEGKVLGDRSRQAEQIFGPALKDGASIVSLLYSVERGQLVEIESFSDWIVAVFGGEGADWPELLELAPSSVTLPQGSGQAIELDLEFRWVRRDTGPSCVMLIATDATQRKQLERVMARAEREHKKAVADLRWLIAGGGQLFVRFLERARSRLGAALRSVRQPGPLLAATIDQVFRDVHTIRAEARCFELDSVDRAIGQAETDLKDLRSGTGDQPQAAMQLPGVVAQSLESGLAALDQAEEQFVEKSPIGRDALSQMLVRRTDVERLVHLTAGRRDEIAELAASLTARPFGESVLSLLEAAPRWAERVGKQVQIEVVNTEHRVPNRLAERLPGILSHLVRNAVAHGIELSSVRIEAGKSAAGLIRLICEGADNAPTIRVEDDGKGLGIQGLGQPEAARAIETLFEPGVTTHVQPDGLAGFGVGLDAVRDDLAKIEYEIGLQPLPSGGTCATLRPSTRRASR